MSTKNQLFAFGLVFLAISIVMMKVSATEYPTPPPVPAKFDTPHDVQRYLNQLHNYYMVVGRPRFGKRGYSPDTFPYLKNNKVEDLDNGEASDLSSANQLFQILDLNGKFATFLMSFIFLISFANYLFYKILGDNLISQSEFKRLFYNNLE